MQESRQLYFGLWIVGGDGYDARQLTDRIAACHSSYWSPLGELWTADPDGGNRAKLTDNGRFVGWSTH